MGSWAATCPVSRLAISPGEEVFWIYARKDYIHSTYELSSSLSHHIRYEQEYLKHKNRDDEFRAKFPEIQLDGISELYKKYIDEPDVVWGFGKYNDYGGVEDLEILPLKKRDDDKNSENEPELIMIRKSVADEMAKFGAKLMPREWYSSDDPRPYAANYGYCVLLVATLTRCQLYGFTLLGRTYPEVDEYREILHMQRVIFRETIKQYVREFWSHLRYEYAWFDDMSERVEKLFKKGK